ncbi:MAG TPA: hypothetical protein VNF73_05660, partial [Candidatus Saccharimonadales bacterium]|nr:hypothetical protein [Candidatus Saccharimonadales bacterium]
LRTSADLEMRSNRVMSGMLAIGAVGRPSPRMDPSASPFVPRDRRWWRASVAPDADGMLVP